MRSYLEKHRLLYGHIGAIIALIIAVIYFVVIPGEVLKASGMQKLVLLYGHSLCWVLLSIASYLWGMKKHRKLTAFFAYSAFIPPSENPGLSSPGMNDTTSTERALALA